MSKDGYNESDDFYMDDSELAAENQMTLIEQQMDLVLGEMEKKVAECRDNLAYSEQHDFKTNFEIIARYVTAISEISMLQADVEAGTIEEAVVLEKIKGITLRVKELSFEDINDYAKQNGTEAKTVSPDAPIEDNDDFDF
jgi:hypothetical protein